MWYLIYVLAAIIAATYFWSWGSKQYWGWLITATAVGSAYAGTFIEFGSIGSAIGGAYCAGLACLVIGWLGRTFYDQIHNPQPTMAM